MELQVNKVYICQVYIFHKVAKQKDSHTLQSVVIKRFQNHFLTREQRKINRKAFLYTYLKEAGERYNTVKCRVRKERQA